MASATAKCSSTGMFCVAGKQPVVYVYNKKAGGEPADFVGGIIISSSSNTLKRERERECYCDVRKLFRY